MQTHFEQELADLKQALLTMASHAESAVRDAVSALVRRDLELANRVRESDETIDKFEVSVDDMAVKLLAKAPLATNLRLITVAMRISQNLERVGDEATKIAKRGRDLTEEPPLKTGIDVSLMANLSLQLLKGALDAFVNMDPAAARTLIPRDKEIDGLNKQYHRELAALMMSEPETITRCLNLMVVAKSLERIGDHGKNIAEEVVYLCEAQDIRHTQRAAQGPLTS